MLGWGERCPELPAPGKEEQNRSKDAPATLESKKKVFEAFAKPWVLHGRRGVSPRFNEAGRLVYYLAHSDPQGFTEPPLTEREQQKRRAI